ncbi:MAG: carbohydrate kinase [Actinomycetaceae bacterium]|nr:carbohydrate kinase [Actinomycetaceae bacterium]
MKSPSALVVGEALVDIVVPTRGDRRELPGGSPANVAITLGRLDRPVELVTWLGDDARGRIVRDHLSESNVKVHESSVRARKTSTALATLDHTGAATYEFDLDWQVPEVEIEESVIVAHAGSIAATLEPGGTEVVHLLERAREQATITYDPNVRPTIMGDRAETYARVKQIIALSDVVKTSDEDMEWLTATDTAQDAAAEAAQDTATETPGNTEAHSAEASQNGSENADSSIEATANEWLQMGASLVVVTRGSQGSSAFIPGARIDIPASKVDVVDTVGAGDSFMGGLIDALWSENLLGANNRYALRHIDRETVVRILARAGSISAITVSRAGANPPWKKELI